MFSQCTSSNPHPNTQRIDMNESTRIYILCYNEEQRSTEEFIWKIIPLTMKISNVCWIYFSAARGRSSNQVRKGWEG